MKLCPYCGKLVEPDGALDARGIYDRCPECWEDIDDVEEIDGD